MSQNTTPVFILGSGRCGTRALFKLFSGIPEIEVHHEYCCTHIQPAAVEYFMGLMTRLEVREKIRELHGAAIYYSPAKSWIDCSNKLSWIIRPLYELFPDAKFVHLTRDGRKVVSSFYHKLSPEIYDDTSVQVMTEWLKNPNPPKPPPEKKYWWNIPQPGQPFYEEFPAFNQFQRICYHWREVTRIIGESFSVLPPMKTMRVKIEDLTSSRAALKTLLDFLSIDYQEHFYEALQRPEGVFFPMDFKLTPEQLEQFKAITGDTMQRLGYDLKSELYEVKY